MFRFRYLALACSEPRLDQGLSFAAQCGERGKLSRSFRLCQLFGRRAFLRRARDLGEDNMEIFTRYGMTLEEAETHEKKWMCGG